MRAAGARDRRPRRTARASATSSAEIAAALPLQIICDMIGHPARATRKRIFELTNVDPRRRRPRVRADDRRAHGRGHGAVPVRRWRSARTALDDPRDDITTHAHAGRGRGRDGSTGSRRRVRLVLPAARRRGQRDDAQRDQPRHARAHRTPRPARDLDGRLRRRCRRPRSRRSCAGRRRSSTSAAPRRATPIVGGQEIKAGEKVVMWYNSANRDERAFADPYRFDVHAHAERARRLRRRRPALLPRRQPRPARDHA